MSVSRSASNKDKSSDSRTTKPLSRAIKGCLGCGFVVVLLVAAMAYGARVGLQAAAREGLLFSPAEPVLESVPGGILRQLQTEGDARAAFAVGVGWQNDHRLTFTSVRLPGFSDMMAFGQRGMGLGFWDEEKREEFARQLVTEMFEQHIEYYDFQERRSGVFVENTGELFLTPGSRSWGPGGHRAVFEAEAVDWVTDGEEGTGPAVYMFDTDNASWTQLAPGREPVWCDDGKWVLFQRTADEGQRALYRISPDGGEETLLYTGDFTLAEQPASPLLSGYLYIWEESDNNGRQLRRIDPESKETTKIPIKSAGMKRGALSPTEIVHTRVEDGSDSDEGSSGDESSEDRTTLIGALDVSTGRLRLIRRGLPEKHGVAFSILDGRAILIKHWGILEGEVSAGDALGEEHLEWLVLSCDDGKLRRGPDRWQAHITSPDGHRVAGSVVRDTRYMGFVPMPTQSIAVWEITDPAGILTGPEEEPDHVNSAGRRSGE